MKRKFIGRGVVAGLGVLACVAIAIPAYAYTGSGTATTTIHPGGNKNVTATCPAGQRVVFGGIGAPLAIPIFSGAALFPQAMYMDATQTKWTTAGVNGGIADGTLGSYAYCSAHAALAAVSKTVTVTGGHVATATATCPAGKVVRSGGFKTPPVLTASGAPRAAVTALTATGRTVSARFVAFESSTTVSAIAYCIASSTAFLKPVTAQTTVSSSAGSTKTVTATCPSNKHLIFGGFDAQYPTPAASIEVLPFTARSTANLKWSVSGYNPTPNAGTLKAIAYCG